jgi:glutathione S-transferase
MFCRKVLEAARSQSVTLQLKDVSLEEGYKAEIIALGGKYQVPFLVDGKRDEKLFESDDIISYITEHGGGALRAGSVRVHKSSGTSQVCG